MHVCNIYLKNIEYNFEYGFVYDIEYSFEVPGKCHSIVTITWTMLNYCENELNLPLGMKQYIHSRQVDSPDPHIYNWEPIVSLMRF